MLRVSEQLQWFTEHLQKRKHWCIWLFMIKKQQTHSKYQGCFSFWWQKPLFQYCCMNNWQYYVNPRFRFIEFSLICVYHTRWNNLCSFSIFSCLKLTSIYQLEFKFCLTGKIKRFIIWMVLLWEDAKSILGHLGIFHSRGLCHHCRWAHNS